MIAAIISDGGGRMMLRMPRVRTAISHSMSSAIPIPIGQPSSASGCLHLLGMACLDRFAQSTDILVKRLAFHHRELARTRQADLDFLDDRCRTAAHDQHAVRKECSLADAVRHKDDGLAIGLPDTE